MKPNFELLAVEGRDELGEGPWWDAAAGLLWWVDIPSRRIRRATLDGIESPALATPSDVGFAVPDSAGGVIAGLATGLGWSPDERTFYYTDSIA